MAAPVILVEASPRQAADGSPVTVRLAGGGGVKPYHYGDQHWRAGINGLPKSVASLDFDGEQLGGGGIAQAMELSWAPSSRTALAEVAGLYWTDAPIVVRVGPEGDDMPPIVTTGIGLETSIDRGVLKIALADQAVDLKRPVLVDRFLGTGGLEGPVEFADLIKSRAWGRCFNVPGQQIDAANNIWVFGDPLHQWRSFDQVRDEGAAAAAATLTVLDAQATAAATFAALQAAPVIEGGGVLCPSIACVKWWTEPAGDLHADIRGEIAGGYVETAPEIVARIVATRSAIPFAAGAVAAAAAARPEAFGWRVDTDSATAASEISEMLGGVSTSWLLIDGAIVFRHWDWTAPTRAARSFAVTRKSTVKPTASRKLGYRRNWSPMARGDLAAIVLVQDVVYDDGTPIADAIDSAGKTADWDGVADPNGTKPANNADVTGDNTSKDTNAVAGRPAESLVRQHDKALTDIDGLFETYGSTVSAAQSADAAATYSQAAADARDQSKAARDTAQAAVDVVSGKADQANAASIAALDAQSAANAAAEIAAQSKMDALGFATTASGQATIATQKADAAGQSASTASAKADLASTKAGEASVSANSAASSENSAAGAANSASQSQLVTATTAADAGKALAAQFPRAINAAAFTIAPTTFPAANAGPLPDVMVNNGRIISDTNSVNYGYGVWQRGLLPYVVGTRVRLTAKLEWVAGYPDQPSGVFYADFFRGDGSLLTEYTIGAEFGGLPGNVPTVYTRDIETGALADCAFVRFGVLTNRKPGNLGQTTAGRTDVLAFYLEDITAEVAAKDAASSSAGSASTASTKATEASQSATAAQADRAAAVTAKGQAEALRNQAAVSESNAAGSASSAVSSANVSASASDAAQRAAGATLPDNFVDPSQWADWANWGGSATFSGGIAHIVNGGSVRSTFFTPLVDGAVYRVTMTHRVINQGGGTAYLGVYTDGGGIAWAIGAVPSAPVGQWQTTTAEITTASIKASYGDVRRIGVGGLIGYAGQSDGEISLLRIENITSEAQARTSAAASSTSASSAAASSDLAGQRASSALNSATSASTKAGEASASAGQAASSASSAQGSQNAAASSASVAASASSEAKASAAATLPSTFAQGPAFWSADYNGPDNRPAAFSSNYSFNPAKGELSIFGGNGVGYSQVAQLGSIPLVAGRRRRLTVRWLTIYAAGQESVSGILFVISLNANNDNVYSPGKGISIVAGATGWGVGNGFKTDTYEMTDDDMIANGATHFRGLFRVLQGGGNPGTDAQQFQLASFTIDDITSETAAAGFAGSASTSASSANASAGAAGNSAVSADSSAQTANAANGGAQQAASASRSSAAAANASEVSAASSATLSAQFSSALANKGANFSDWPSTAGWPGYWRPWGNSANTKINPGLVGRYGYRQDVNYNVDETGLVTDQYTDGGLVGLGAGTYVIRADVTLVGGDFSGAGILFRGLDANGNLVADEPVNFAASESNVTPGVATGGGVPGTRYVFTRLCTMPAGVTQVMIFLMTAWRGFAANPASKYLQWNECGVRPATSAEVKANTANVNAGAALAQVAQLASTTATDISAVSSRVTTTIAQVNGLEGRTSITEQSVADINGKIAARLVLKAVSPDGTAEIDIFSGGGTSGIRFGGNTTFTGKLEIGTGSGPRVEIASNRIIFDNGSVMKASGIGFGSNSQFIEWVGPSKASLAQCTEAEAIQYIKTDGSAYFGGALSAGTLKNAAQTTVSSATASVTTGQFGSNGRQRLVTVSFFFAFSRSGATTCPANPLTPTVTLELHSGTDAGGTLLATQTFTGSYSCERGTAGEPGYVGEQLSGAFTFTDNSGGNTASYFVRITNRSTNTIPQQQSLGVISVEQ